MLSEPFTMTHPSWVAWHSMAYNFLELSKPLPQDKAVIHEGTIKTAEHQIIDVFELWCWRRLLSPLDFKEIKPVNLKEINPDYIERTNAEAPVLWPPDGKSQLVGKDPDAGKD